MLNDPHRFPRTAGGVLHLFRLSGKRIAPWNLQITPRWSTLCFFWGGDVFCLAFLDTVVHYAIVQPNGWLELIQIQQHDENIRKHGINFSTCCLLFLPGHSFFFRQICKESEAQLNARNNTVHKLKESNTDLAAWKHQFLQHANSCLLIEIYYKLLIYIHDKKKAPPN